MIATYPAEAKFCTYANHSFCPPGHGCIDNFWTTSMKAERLNFHGVYDTVVMMNVLEHCEDAVAILTNIYASLKHGGIFVFMDRFNFDDVSPGARGDAWRAAATGAPWLHDGPPFDLYAVVLRTPPQFHVPACVSPPRGGVPAAGVRWQEDAGISWPCVSGE